MSKEDSRQELTNRTVHWMRKNLQFGLLNNSMNKYGTVKKTEFSMVVEINKSGTKIDSIYDMLRKFSQTEVTCVVAAY